MDEKALQNSGSGRKSQNQPICIAGSSCLVEMRSNDMRLKTVKLVATASAIMLGATAATISQPTNNPPQPAIVLTDCPLTVAITVLARECGINFIFDPKLSDQFTDSNGKVVQEPTVTIHWENITPMDALARMLKEHNLVMDNDRFTSVARITYPNQTLKRVDSGLLGSDTNVIPVVQFWSVPLDVALNNLIQKSHLNVTLDPALSNFLDPVTHRLITAPIVHISWVNITARKAIIALCKNYGLIIATDPATGIVVIKR